MATCDALKLLTFCVLVLRNGFTITGESACASPENFDAELGKKIARANAINKVWPLMGYALKYTTQPPKSCTTPETTTKEETMNLSPHQQRVVTEKAELDDKRAKLNGFFESAIFAGLPKEEQSRLWRQSEVMEDYSEVLGKRIAAFV